MCCRWNRYRKWKLDDRRRRQGLLPVPNKENQGWKVFTTKEEQIKSDTEPVKVSENLCRAQSVIFPERDGEMLCFYNFSQQLKVKKTQKANI